MRFFLKLGEGRGTSGKDDSPMTLMSRPDVRATGGTS